MPFEYEVFIPARNAEGTIAATVASIRRQIVPPQRLAVIDDGSTDRTAATAAAAGAEVIAAPGQGLCAVQNFALEQAASPFIALVDSDDLWLERMSTLQASAWATLDDGAAAFGPAYLTFSGPPPEPPQAPPGTEIERRVTVEELWRENQLGKSATVFRARALRDIGGYVPMHNAEDYDVLLRLVAAGWSLWKSDVPACLIRVRPGSRSWDPASMLDTEAAVLQSFYDSDFRRRMLPRADIDDRLRSLWWRTVARAAHQRHPLSAVPPLDRIVRSRVPERIVGAALRNRAIAAAAATAWRGYRSAVPRRRSKRS